MTCDNATENASCAKKMGCTDDDPKFPNPSPEYEGEFIWWYFDPPHILKLFRNHFLDQGKKNDQFIGHLTLRHSKWIMKCQKQILL